MYAAPKQAPRISTARGGQAVRGRLRAWVAEQATAKLTRIGLAVTLVRAEPATDMIKEMIAPPLDLDALRPQNQMHTVSGKRWATGGLVITQRGQRVAP